MGGGVGQGVPKLVTPSEVHVHICKQSIIARWAGSARQMMMRMLALHGLSIHKLLVMRAGC